MSTTNKYSARGTYWHKSEQRCLSKTESNWYKAHKNQAQDIVYFDSLFELKVYRTLTQMFGFYAIEIKYSVFLLPKGRCHPRGKKWTIDFAVKPERQSERPLMLVEAKGFPTESFLAQLAVLEATNPAAFNSLFLIFDKEIPPNRVLTNLKKTNNYALGKILLLSEFVEKYSSLITV